MPVIRESYIQRKSQSDALQGMDGQNRMKKQDLREGISHERIYGFDMLNDNTSPFKQGDRAGAGPSFVLA